MIFEFGYHKIDVDVEKTRAFYEQAELLTEGCECLNCKKYEKAVDFADVEVKEIFAAFGADMKKAAEVWGYFVKEKGKMEYHGFYHLCGRLLEGGFLYQRVADKQYMMMDDCMHVVNENFQIGFAEEIQLLEEGFPEPVVQLEFSITLPWVLEEDYIE